MTAVRPLPVDLLAMFGRILWGHESGDGSIGASSLAGRDTFLAAVRELRDDLLDLTLERDRRYLVQAPDEADPLRPYVDSLWGDLLGADDEVVIGAGQREPHAVDAEPLPPGRLIVVLGAARSGTTWLHRVLSAHPAVAGTALGETWLFPDVVPIWEGLDRQVGREDLVVAVRRFCDRLLAAMRDREKPTADHVCEKTPATVWRLPMMAALYPDAHFVHIVRDGRDAALSMTRADAGRDDLADAAQAWVAAVTEVRNNSGLLPRFREIRYEDLLAEPSASVREVWGWIGLEVTSAVLADAARRSAQRITPLAPAGDIGSGKWRSLSAEDQAVLQRVEGELLETLGYC